MLGDSANKRQRLCDDELLSITYEGKTFHCREEIGAYIAEYSHVVRAADAVQSHYYTVKTDLLCTPSQLIHEVEIYQGMDDGPRIFTEFDLPIADFVYALQSFVEKLSGDCAIDEFSQSIA